MKKVGITLLTAFIGGAVAIGGYKLIENQNAENMTLEERQNVYFTKNPQKISSAGDVDFVQAAAAVTPAVVHIKTSYDGSSSSSRSMEDPFGGMFEEFFGAPRGGGRQRMPQQASGSGVIVTPDGYIVTNNHVVDKASKIEIILPDNRSYTAKVIGTDSNTDLALIKVEAKNLPVIKLGNSDNVRVGEWVLAVGYPLSLQTTVTAGIVSAKGRSIGILNENNQRSPNRDPQSGPAVSSAIESFIQTDAAINPGNSGGALVNTEGELIGINTAIASQRGGYEGYGFAIPINLAKKIMDDFIKFGSVKRGFIGVTFNELNASVAKELGVNQISGLYVNEVMEGGGAQAAGLKKGDIITKVDGNKILSSSDLQEKVGRLRPGDKVQLSYLRDGSERNTSVTLKGESSVNIASNSNAANKIIAALGGNFASLTPAQKQKYRVNNGVVVTGVRQGGLLHENQITRGTIITHINGKAVNSLDDIQDAVLASNSNIMRIDGISTDGVRFWGTFEIAR